MKKWNVHDLTDVWVNRRSNGEQGHVIEVDTTVQGARIVIEFTDNLYYTQAISLSEFRKLFKVIK